MSKEIYKLTGKNNGTIIVSIIPKSQRQDGDSIELLLRNSKEKEMHNICMKDWEALAIIEGLSRALLYKKGGFR